jgi:hypothetical protein
MKRIAMFAGTALVGAALLTGGAGTASADPYDCSPDFTYNGVIVTCYGGTGEYRAIAKCKWGSFTTEVYATTWSRVGRGSYAVCYDSWDMYGWDVQVR